MAEVVRRIPTKILKLFVQNDFSAEERLLTWLSENKIEELDCSRLRTIVDAGNSIRISFFQIIKIAWTIANSSVHTVDFSCNDLGSHGPFVAANLTRAHSKVRVVNFNWNRLGASGPLVAANLTRKHSKVEVVHFAVNNLGEHGPLTATNITGPHSQVHTVDFSMNNLAEHGPDVAANLTGPHSQVHTVDFGMNNFAEHGTKVAVNLTGEHSKVRTVDLSQNGCEKNMSEMIENLTGMHSKIINITGIELTPQQLKENAINLLMHSSELSKSSLEGLVFKACYEALTRDLSDESLPHYITFLASQGQTKGIMALIKALLFHKGILKINETEDNMDEAVQDYIAKNCQRVESIDQITVGFRELTFSEGRVSNKECDQRLAAAEEQRRAETIEQPVLALKKCKCSA